MRLGIILCLSFLSFWSFAQIGDSTVSHFSDRWNTENDWTVKNQETTQNSDQNTHTNNFLPISHPLAKNPTYRYVGGILYALGRGSSIKIGI
jgi:hypothetical protein